MAQLANKRLVRFLFGIGLMLSLAILVLSILLIMIAAHVFSLGVISGVTGLFALSFAGAILSPGMCIGLLAMIMPFGFLMTVFCASRLDRTKSGRHLCCDETAAEILANMPSPSIRSSQQGFAAAAGNASYGTATPANPAAPRNSLFGGSTTFSEDEDQIVANNPSSTAVSAPSSQLVLN